MSSLKTKTRNLEWKSLSLQKIPEMGNFVSFHKFKKGQTIFYEGHMPYGLFIMASGQAEIKFGNNKYEEISAPALLGVSAFKERKPFSGTIEAISDCDVYFLSISSFNELNKAKHPFEKWVKKNL